MLEVPHVTSYLSEHYDLEVTPVPVKRYVSTAGVLFDVYRFDVVTQPREPDLLLD